MCSVRCRCRTFRREGKVSLLSLELLRCENSVCHFVFSSVHGLFEYGEYESYFCRSRAKSARHFLVV
ncbi:hypothetical protein IF2G_02292 [Cordyceps javanica]|nr:hypothetical protein IF2G_02292 [Cordyceps javanica]